MVIYSVSTICLHSFKKGSLIVMHMQMRSFSYKNIGWKSISNCISDDLESCNNNVLGPNAVYLFVYSFPSFKMFSLIFMYMQTIYMYFAYVTFC